MVLISSEVDEAVDGGNYVFTLKNCTFFFLSFSEMKTTLRGVHQFSYSNAGGPVQNW